MYMEYCRRYFIDILPLISVYYRLDRSHILQPLSTFFYFIWEKYWLETKRILIPVAPPQLSSNTLLLSPPSVSQLPPCSIHLHKTLGDRQAPGGPVRLYFAQHPSSLFSHLSFSLPVRTSISILFHPTFQLPPSLVSIPSSCTHTYTHTQRLLTVWDQHSSSFIFRFQCCSQSTMLHYALSLPLMSRILKKSCFQDWLESGHFRTLTSRGSPQMRSNKIFVIGFYLTLPVCFSSFNEKSVWSWRLICRKYKETGEFMIIPHSPTLQHQLRKYWMPWRPVQDKHWSYIKGF